MSRPLRPAACAPEHAEHLARAAARVVVAGAAFIAPHTLTARALVVAPDDVLHVVNRSLDEPVDIMTDGRSVSTLGPQERAEVRFRHDVAFLAQAPDASFYHRLREKLGRLSY